MEITSMKWVLLAKIKLLAGCHPGDSREESIS